MTVGNTDNPLGAGGLHEDDPLLEEVEVGDETHVIPINGKHPGKNQEGDQDGEDDPDGEVPLADLITGQKPLEEDDDPPPSGGRRSRAERRIHQLHDDRIALEEQLAHTTGILEQTTQQLAEVQDRLQRVEGHTATQTVNEVETQINNVKQKIIEAKEAGNTAEEVELISQLQELHATRLALKRSQAAPADRPQRGAPTQGAEETSPRSSAPNDPRRATAKLPVEGQQWIRRNASWFMKPGYERQTAMAYAIDAEMTREGLHPSQPGYYAELERRLRQDLTSLRGAAPRQEGGRPRRQTAPVIGNARPNGNGRGIRLTPEQMAVARGLGFSDDPEAMKTYVKHIGLRSNTDARRGR